MSSKVSKDLWESELADLPMPEGATYGDFYQLCREKEDFELHQDQSQFDDGLRRLRAQRPELRESIDGYLKRSKDNNKG